MAKIDEIELKMELKTPCNDRFGAGLGPFRTEIIPFGRLGAMVGARGAFHNLPTHPCSSFNTPKFRACAHPHHVLVQLWSL